MNLLKLIVIDGKGEHYSSRASNSEQRSEEERRGEGEEGSILRLKRLRLLLQAPVSQCLSPQTGAFHSNPNKHSLKKRSPLERCGRNPRCKGRRDSK